MLRKIILTAVLCTGILGSLAFATPAATAAAPAYRHSHGGHYHARYTHGTRYRLGARFNVVYNNRGCWDVYGTYGNRSQAQRMANSLRQRNFAVRVDRVAY